LTTDIDATPLRGARLCVNLAGEQHNALRAKLQSKILRKNGIAYYGVYACVRNCHQNLFDLLFSEVLANTETAPEG
jgi:hypothetical protein